MTRGLRAAIFFLIALLLLQVESSLPQPSARRPLSEVKYEESDQDDQKLAGPAPAFSNDELADAKSATRQSREDARRVLEAETQQTQRQPRLPVLAQDREESTHNATRVGATRALEYGGSAGAKVASSVVPAQHRYAKKVAVFLYFSLPLLLLYASRRQGPGAYMAKHV